jgi:hypothetical protein
VGQKIKSLLFEGDRMIATIMTVLFILYYFEAATIPKTNMEDKVGPGAFPQLVGIFGLLMVACFFYKIFRSGIIEYEKIIGVWDEIKGVAILFMVIGYVLLIDLIGYPPATFVFVALAVKFLGEKTWVIAAVVSGVLTAVCYAFFVWFLDITFSTGDFWLMIMGE